MIRLPAKLSLLVVWVLLSLAIPPVSAQSPEELFQIGNTAYGQERYADAAATYRDVLRYRIQDPRLEFNLANAEFRLGHLGRAILHYERALRLDPTDMEIRANLDYARSFRFDRLEVDVDNPLLGSVRGIQDRMGPDRQGWAIVVLVWAIFGIVAWALARPGRWNATLGWAMSGLTLALLVAGLSWYATYQRLEGTDLAVVLDEAVEVLAGPGGNNPTLFTVHEGLTVEVRDRRADWTQVSLPNGFNGWIPSETIEPV